MRLRTATLLLAASALVVSATPALAKKKPRKIDPEFAATLPVTPAPHAANGSIFQVSQGYAPLTSGPRAAMVGDLLTITLVERTQAVKSSTQTSGRKADIGITPPTTGPLSFFNESDAKMGSASNFDGKGQATQSNALQGEVSVTVAAVYPNGTMLVRGQKQVTLNRGDEFIQISGLVRQADISADNRILSTRVADARITYSGKGEVARSSRQGWLQRFFTAITPF